MPDAVQRDRLLLVLRFAAFCGLLIAGYLSYLALTGQTAPGCGEGSAGCSKVLSSRWSKLFGLPVSVFAVGAYLVILASSIHAGPANPQRHREGAWRIIGLFGIAAGLSALWFIALQLFVLNGFCMYCMTAHACSLLVAGIALVRSRGLLPKLGVLPAGAMIALQLLIAPPAPTLDDADSRFRFTNFDPANTPTLGDPGAPHVMALVFDYNCTFCRRAHRFVAEAVERYNGRLACVMLPTALDPACNPATTTLNPNSTTSCELSRLSLAVWLARPDAYAEFDRQVITLAERFAQGGFSEVAYLAAARRFAEELVPRDELDRALADPLIDEHLDTNSRIYGLAEYKGRRAVPRLIVAGHALPAPAEAASLHGLLEQAYPGLAPKPASDQ